MIGRFAGRSFGAPAASKPSSTCGEDRAGSTLVSGSSSLTFPCSTSCIAATDVNYPCGTQELAVAVSDLVAREPDPAHAVIGLRNHGITCTGESLSEILDRVAPKVLRQVPMT